MSSKRIEPDTPGTSPLSAAGRFFFYWLPLIGLCGAIFWQSSFPSVHDTNWFLHQDKGLHLAAYGLMAFLAARALDRERPGLRRSTLWLLASAFAVLFGLSDEIHQSFVPGRTASIADWIADILGSAAGAWIFIRRR